MIFPKNDLVKSWSCAVCAILVAAAAAGQCVPSSFNFGSEWGIYVGTDDVPLPSGYVGAEFSQDFFFQCPSYAIDIVPDTPLNAPVDSVVLSVFLVEAESLDTLMLGDLGLELNCNNLGDCVDPCTFLGGGAYCFSIEGVPLAPGDYTLGLNGEVWATVFGFPLVTPFTLESWPWTVAAPETMVTFMVDMSNEVVSAEGVHVAGNFQGWNPSTTTLTDDDEDGVYEVTAAVPSDLGTVQYKFLNGNAWGTDEFVPEACALVGTTNRYFESEGAIELDAPCFGQCGPCGTTTILFKVDMSNEESINPVGVHLNGNFNGWDGTNFLPMEDPEGDMVYTRAITLDGDMLNPVDTAMFKFVNGNAWGYDEVPEGPCADLGVRVLPLPGPDMTYELDNGVPYCYNSCESCIAPTEVTFRVDMSAEDAVSANGVSVAGSFQGWVPGQDFLLDPDGDLIFEITMFLPQGEYEFKFINGDNWGGDGDGNISNENPPEGCTWNGSRVLVVGDSPVLVQYCYNQCNAICSSENEVVVELVLDAQEWLLENNLETIYCEGPFLTNELTSGDGQGAFTWAEGPMMIPDNQTECLMHTIQVTGYGNEIISDSIFLESVSVNLEHSFMGDLTITLVCPDGSSVGLHQQGGGGTSLGEPIDVDNEPDMMGIGYDYTWSDNSNNGTWVDNPGGTLPSGTYLPVQPFVGLDGCPLNGNWTIEFCDSWGSDNGFLFEWGLQFNMPEVIEPMEMPMSSDGLNRLHIEMSLNEAVSGFGFETYGSTDGSVNSLVPELQNSSCGADGYSRYFQYSGGVQDVSPGDTLRYEHLPTGEVFCAGSCLPCVVEGCMDPSAENFDPYAVEDDGSCFYSEFNCATIGLADWESLDIGFYPDGLSGIAGIEGAWEFAFNVPNVVVDSSGAQYMVESFVGATWLGLPQGNLEVTNPEAIDVSAGGQACLSLSGVSYESGIFPLTLSGTLVVSVFGAPFVLNDFPVSMDIEFAVNPVSISGCVYFGAVNFMPAANQDDGSCLFPGCTDPGASNYSPVFNFDDGSCENSNDSGGGGCPSDINADQLVSIADLLVLLLDFGSICSP